METAIPEHGHSHAHGTGLPWLDIVVGVSVTVISVISLVVSIAHGKTMEKMVEQNEKLVAASTMPFLTFYGSNLDPDSKKPAVTLILKNGGVGPAVIDSFELRYKGKPFASMSALVRACCSSGLDQGAARGAAFPGVYSNVTGTVLPAREKLDVIFVSSEASPQLIRSLTEAREEVTARACYCSVLEQCWVTDFKAERPKPTPACTKSENDVLW